MEERWGKENSVSGAKGGRAGSQLKERMMPKGGKANEGRKRRWEKEPSGGGKKKETKG